MVIQFSKMHGLGNDFVVLDAVNQTIALDPVQVRRIADRRFGIGCDQILLVEPARSPDTEFYYRIYNPDGGEVEQCGNGARCFARFVHEKGLSNKREIEVGTAAGNILLLLQGDDSVRVNMGPPRFDPPDIPFEAPQTAERYELQLEGESVQIGALSMGNPHAVLVVEQAACAEVERLGPAIEAHPRFPRRVNVGFMAIRSRNEIDLRVYERGAGETLACGTGACAAMVHGRRIGALDEEVRVNLPGGSLVVSWPGNDEPVWMTGPAVLVYDGTLDLERLSGPKTR